MYIYLFHCCVREANIQELHLEYKHASIYFDRVDGCSRWRALSSMLPYGLEMNSGKICLLQAMARAPKADSWTESEEKDRCIGQEGGARASNSRTLVSVLPSYCLVQPEEASGSAWYPKDTFRVTQQGSVLLGWFE